MGCLNKLLSLIRKREEHHPVFYLKPPTPPDFIIVPPPEQNEQVEPSAQEETAKQTNDECEEPMPLQEFHAVDLEVARRRATEKGLFVLFKEHDRWEMFNRRKVYWSLTPSFTMRLLRLETDMRSETEFTPAEQVILKDLALKGWIKTLKNGGVYYYGLNSRTAMILRRQMMNQSV